MIMIPSRSIPLQVPYFVPADGEDEDSDSQDSEEEEEEEDGSYQTTMDVETETQSRPGLDRKGEGKGSPPASEGKATSEGTGSGPASGVGAASPGDAMDVSEDEQQVSLFDAKVLPLRTHDLSGCGCLDASELCYLPTVTSKFSDCVMSCSDALFSRHLRHHDPASMPFLLSPQQPSSGAGGGGGGAAAGGSFGGHWVETKAALSLEMARPSVFAARRTAAAAVAVSGGGQSTALATRTGSRFGLLAMDANTDDDDVDHQDHQDVQAGAEQQPVQREQEQQLFDPATKRFLEVTAVRRVLLGGGYCRATGIFLHIRFPAVLEAGSVFLEMPSPSLRTSTLGVGP